MDDSRRTTPTISLVMTTQLGASAQRVFTALTTAPDLAAWFGPQGWVAPREHIVVEPRLFGRYALRLVHGVQPCEQFDIDAMIVTWAPGRRLTIEEDTPDGRIALTFALEDAPDGCVLHLCQGPFTPEIADMNRVSWESAVARLAGHLRGSYAWWNDLRLAG